MPETPDEAFDVAIRLTDALAIDWSHAPGDPSLSHVFGGLETLERICAAHRAIVSERPSPAPDFVWGPLQVYELIGQGAFGQVFRAWDPRLEIEVALKLFRDTPTSGVDFSVRQLLDEARGLARVRHPSVVVVHGADIHDGHVGLWVDYVQGRTLEERLAEGPLPIATVVDIGVTLSSALAAVHDAGFAHGDVKAANVMERPEGHVVLTDFGSCVRLTATDGTGWARSGTPLAMAPELFDGAAVSPASDVYALGALLFRLLTGHHPIEGSSARAIAIEHRIGRRPQLRLLRPDAPAPLVRAIDRALERRAAARFQTMAVFEATLKHSATPDHNLPRPARSFIGRDRERRALAERLENAQLLTVTGVGGGGKSRLALEVARDVLCNFADGAYWHELTAISAGDVPAAIGGSFDLRDVDEPDRIATAIGERRVLLILDNCEHVVDAVAQLATTILDRCPNAALLVTTRQPLGVDGEERFPLEPMPIDADAPETSESLDCVRLFAERARAVRPHFELTPEVVSVVERICRRLDGLPLAIELAAAGARAASVSDIERHLENRLPGRAATSSRPHQATLEATFDWSYEPLTDQEKQLLRRLTSCSDGWQIDAVEALTTGDAAQALELHTNLVDRSMIAVTHSSDGLHARYRLLDTLATHLRTKCGAEERAESDRTLAAHYVATLTELGATAGEDATASRWLAWVDIELDNVRTLLRRLLECRELDTLNMLLHAVRHYWHRRGRHREACAFYRNFWSMHDRQWTDATAAENWCAAAVLSLQLDQVSEAEQYLDAVRAGVTRGAPEKYELWRLQNLGALRIAQGDLDGAAEMHEQCLAGARRLGDRNTIATALGAMARVHAHRQHFARADHDLAEAETLFRELGSRRNLALCLYRRGVNATLQEDDRAARRFFEEAARLQRELELSQDITNTLWSLGNLYADAGEPEGARACAEEMLERARVSGGPESLAHLMLGTLARNRGNIDAAEGYFVDALRPQLGASPRLAGPALEGLAAIALDRQRYADVGWMLGAAALLTRGYDAMYEPARAAAIADNEEVAERARAALGSDAFDRFWREGHAMSYDHTVARAIESWALAQPGPRGTDPLANA